MSGTATGTDKDIDTDADRQSEMTRLRDEVEQLRTALEASADEVTRLLEDRDRLLQRVMTQARELQSANEAYAQANRDRDGRGGNGDNDAVTRFQSEQDQEELRVAFEEMQVLTEELESANTSLRETNTSLDRRVEERTRELGAKNVALGESELRFRILVEGMPQLVWRARGGGEWTWASSQWTDHTGLTVDESKEEGWLQALHPDDRGKARAAWSRTEESGAPLDLVVRIGNRSGEDFRHFRMRASAVQAGDDRLEWLGTCTDIDDLLQLQKRQQLLLAELQHRVRNILSVVRSVFMRTINAGGELDDIADHFRGRLDSLARTQVVVTQKASGLVDLDSLIRDELLSVGASDGPKLTIGGPDVSLQAKMAESIGLAIHELTTNALKYGALKVPGARLDIRWRIERDDKERRKLVLTWAESDMPPISPTPARRGFGSELITEALPYQLGAETNMEFRESGVRCAICLPLPDDAASMTRSTEA